MEMKKLKRPKMSGLLHAQIKRNLSVIFLIATTIFCVGKFGIVNPKMQRYADFYKNYDADKEFEKMRVKGLFQSG